MFGRKGKKDEEEVGLAGLGTGGVDPSLSATPTVSVTPNPSPSSPPTIAPAAPSTSPSTAPPVAAQHTPEIPFAAFGPGMVPPNAAAVLGQILSGHGPVGELVRQIKSDPEGFRQRMLAQAQAAGVSTTIMSPNWIAPAGGGAAQPAHVDVVDELTKAADLHDKGVLSDAEFETLKKKLLGE
jgi:putative oligomerization/nucleic acid binding protein